MQLHAVTGEERQAVTRLAHSRTVPARVAQVALDGGGGRLRDRVVGKRGEEVTSVASFEQWLEALQPVYDLSPGRAAELMCPNCGVRALQLRFVTHREGGWAYLRFWCDNCLEGRAPGPGDVAGAFPRVQDVDANIPNERVVPSSGRGGRGSGPASSSD